MSNVKHRIGFGRGFSNNGVSNDVTAKQPIDFNDIMTADETGKKADGTINYADENYYFTADSTRYFASATNI